MGAPHLAAGGFAQERDPDVTKQDELATWASECSSGVEPWHRRQLTLDPIWAGVKVDGVPLSMAGYVIELVGHEQQQIVDRQLHVAGLAPG